MSKRPRTNHQLDRDSARYARSCRPMIDEGMTPAEIAQMAYRDGYRMALGDWHAGHTMSPCIREIDDE